MVTEKDILDMYSHLRKTNQSIPDETLDWMKTICFAALESEHILVTNFTIDGNKFDGKSINAIYPLKENVLYNIQITPIT